MGFHVRMEEGLRPSLEVEGLRARAWYGGSGLEGRNGSFPK